LLIFDSQIIRVVIKDSPEEKGLAQSMRQASQLDVWRGQKMGSIKTQDQPGTPDHPVRQNVSPPLNMEDALERVLGDGVFIKILFEEFLCGLGTDIEELRATLCAGVADELGRKAHRLKGAAASLSMEPLAEIAFMLEKKGNSGDLDSAADLIRQIEVEGERVKVYLSAYDWTRVGA
jgi:HPt (histidine-containing phosphotransfer) domain-containing protein